MTSKRSNLQLSRPQARRVALAAQGFGDRPHTTPTLRTVDRTIARTGVFQVDSVNILARAHHLPVYSRAGSYPEGLLHRANSGREGRRLVEYWAHVQAMMPVELWPLMRHRMAEFSTSDRHWGGGQVEAGLTERLLKALEAEGALPASAFAEEGPRRSDHWGWNWSSARTTLHHLFRTGEVAMAGRTTSFEPLYDLPERVLPPSVLATPTPEPADARRELVDRAAGSHGVATVACLADYYRMGVADTRRAVAELVENGVLEPARVECWEKPAYLHVDAARPRRIAAATLLSPFDPVVWNRERALALFDFHYRIEIYTPAARRVFGYYVLPFLLGDELVARVDLKADRATGRLLVLGAFAEAGAPATTADALAVELARMGEWVGCPEVVLGRPEVGEACRGDLAPELEAASTAYR